jgi:hypothetical protein
MSGSRSPQPYPGRADGGAARRICLGGGGAQHEPLGGEPRCQGRGGPALATIQESVERVRSAKGQVAGVVRLNAPRLALPMAITPAIVAMSGLYPDLTIEVTLDEGLIEAADAVDGGGVGET